MYTVNKYCPVSYKKSKEVTANKLAPCYLAVAGVNLPYVFFSQINRYFLAKNLYRYKNILMMIQSAKKLMISSAAQRSII